MLVPINLDANAISNRLFLNQFINQELEWIKKKQFGQGRLHRS